jgi:hypothetical protein
MRLLASRCTTAYCAWLLIASKRNKNATRGVFIQREVGSFFLGAEKKMTETVRRGRPDPLEVDNDRHSSAVWTQSVATDISYTRPSLFAFFHPPTATTSRGYPLPRAFLLFEKNYYKNFLEKESFRSFSKANCSSIVCFAGPEARI